MAFLYWFFGGAGGIRTLDRALQPYNGLANRRLQPLGHSSVAPDMPDPGMGRKRQISGCLVPCHLVFPRRLARANPGAYRLADYARFVIAKSACDEAAIPP